MKKISLEFDKAELSMDKAASVVRQVMKDESQFDIETSGMVDEGFLRFGASMNSASISDVAGETRITINATENLADLLRTELRSEAGRASMGDNIPDTGRDMDTDTGQSEPDVDMINGPRPNAEVEATMVVYDTGQVQIEIDGEKEMHDTVAGMFLSPDNEVAQAYTHNFDTVSRSDVDEMLRNVRDLLQRE